MTHLQAPTWPSLLALAKANSPEYAGMLHEAQAARERIEPAGALADPKLRIELMDITKMGEQVRPSSPVTWAAHAIR